MLTGITKYAALFNLSGYATIEMFRYTLPLVAIVSLFGCGNVGGWPIAF